MPLSAATGIVSWGGVACAWTSDREKCGQPRRYARPPFALPRGECGQAQRAPPWNVRDAHIPSQQPGNVAVEWRDLDQSPLHLAHWMQGSPGRAQIPSIGLQHAMPGGQVTSPHSSPGQAGCARRKRPKRRSPRMKRMDVTRLRGRFQRVMGLPPCDTESRACSSRSIAVRMASPGLIPRRPR